MKYFIEIINDEYYYDLIINYSIDDYYLVHYRY